jgi:hypothetical protein
MEIKLESINKMFRRAELLWSLYEMNKKEENELLPKIDAVNDEGVDIMREVPHGSLRDEALKRVDYKFQGLCEELKTKKDRASHWFDLYTEVKLVIIELGLLDEYADYRYNTKKGLIK